MGAVLKQKAPNRINSTPLRVERWLVDASGEAVNLVMANEKLGWPNPWWLSNNNFPFVSLRGR